MKKKINLGIVAMLLFCLIMPLTATAEKEAGVRLNKTKVTISVGGISRLKVENTTEKITWKSSKKKVAKVFKNGAVRGIKPGKAVITAKMGKKTFKCKVVVKNRPKLVNDDVKLFVGGTDFLFVKGTRKKIVWSTSDENIIKVEKENAKTAKITAVNKGIAVVVAKVGKKKLECSVSVQSAVETETTDLIVTNSASRPILHLTNEIMVSSSDESVAKVNIVYEGLNGLYGINSNLYVYGLKDGTVDISIKNKFNDEVVTFKAIINKLKENSAKQKVIDYILNNYNDGRCGYFSQYYEKSYGDIVSFSKTYNRGNLTVRAYYVPDSDDIGFCYEDRGEYSTLVWHMTPISGEQGKFNVTFIENPLPVPGSSFSVEKREFSGVYDVKNNLEDQLVFKDEKGNVAGDFDGKYANEFHTEAFKCINNIVETEIGVKMSDL